MTDFTTLALERRGAIEILSLDRPDSLNAISPEMVEEASAYFSGLYDRLDVRVVILRGNGRAFSAGADLGSVAFAESGAGRPQRQLAHFRRQPVDQRSSRRQRPAGAGTGARQPEPAGVPTS